MDIIWFSPGENEHHYGIRINSKGDQWAEWWATDIDCLNTECVLELKIIGHSISYFVSQISQTLHIKPNTHQVVV
jgi:hypothetical protein